MKTNRTSRLWFGLVVATCVGLGPRMVLAQPGGGMNPFQQFFQGQRGGASGQVATPRVVTVADEYSNSLVISAPEEQWAVLTNLLAELDRPADEISEMRVFKLQFADPQETANVISELFPDPTGQQGNRNNRARIARPGTTTQSSRALEQTRVLAVPDPRTRSVIVSAAAELMDQIAEVIARLDSDPARKQKVFVIPVENTDPTLAAETLRGLFEGQNSRTRGTASRSTTGRQQMGGQLNTRATQNQTRGTTTGGFNSQAFGGTSSGGQ